MTTAPKTLNGAQAMTRLLEAHGVTHIFGLCGDTSLPFYDALHRLDHGITHILTRDERHAAYMADAYARVSGKPGVCEAPSGGGATYLLPGLVEANESSVAVLGITSDVAVDSIGRYPLTELRQDELFRPLTKWNGVISNARRIPLMVRAAFRAMTTGTPGAAHLGFPFDVQQGEVDGAEIWAQPEFRSFPAWRSAPAPAAVEQLAARLMAAQRPLLICGGGVVLAGAEAPLAAVAERLNLAVATTVSGQGALADSHPNCLGVIGSNGGVAETRAFVEEADLVVFIGCRAGSVTTERRRIPAAHTRVAHIDSNPMTISANYRTDVAVVGDIALALQALLTALAEHPPRDCGAAPLIAAAKERKFRSFEALANANDTPIKPERVVHTLNRLLPPDAIICADAGTPCPYFSAYYRTPLPGRHFITNRAHGALGYSLAASIGAQLGRPSARVVAAMGDGSFGLAVGELETLSRLALPITIVVFNNSAYGWIKSGQKSGFDKRYFSVDFTRSNHAKIAAAYGLRSWRVEQPQELEPALRQALACDTPTLVDIISQPLEEAQAPVSEWIA